MCMCCGPFAPTQFHFDCCGVFDNMYTYMYKRSSKKHETILGRSEASFNRTSWIVSDAQIVRYAWVLVAKDKSNRPVADSIRSVLQESWS